MMIAKVLISIALVFTAIGLASAVTLGRRTRHPSAKPSYDQPCFGYTREQLVAITARADQRAALDPMRLRRPLAFSAPRSGAAPRPPAGCAPAGVADGGRSVPTEVPAIRVLRLIREGAMSDQLPFSSRQVANMLAVRAVKHASEFLGGKFGLTLLGMHAEQLQLDLLLSDPLANSLLNTVRLLNLAMLSTSRLASEVAVGEIESVARLDRWMHVIAALAELVQHERARFSREHGAAA